MTCVEKHECLFEDAELVAYLRAKYVAYVELAGTDKKYKACHEALPYDFAHVLRKVADDIDGGWEYEGHDNG